MRWFCAKELMKPRQWDMFFWLLLCVNSMSLNQCHKPNLCDGHKLTGVNTEVCKNTVGHFSLRRPTKADGEGIFYLSIFFLFSFSFFPFLRRFLKPTQLLFLHFFPRADAIMDRGLVWKIGESSSYSIWFCYVHLALGKVWIYSPVP